MERRYHENTNGVTRYPETDKYIPQAEILADNPGPRGTWLWSRAFLKAMDKILFEKGLRVL